MIFNSSCLGIKSRKSLGHSKADVPLTLIIGMNTKKIALHKYYFDILYWHVNFNDLIAIEEVWNIRRGDVSHCPTINLAHLAPRYVGNNHETV